MNRQARLALQFFLPPLLSALPLAVGAAADAGKSDEYSPASMFAVFVGIGFAGAAIPAMVSAFLAEAVVARGFDPKRKVSVGAWTFFGLLSGIAVSETIYAGASLGGTALTYAVAWGLTGLLVCGLERQTTKKEPNQTPEPMPLSRHGSS